MENPVKHGNIRILICTFFFKKNQLNFLNLGFLVCQAAIIMYMEEQIPINDC